MGLFGENERLLTSGEEGLIRKVFKSAALPPLSAFRIRDGLSPTGTPFTDSDYSIMVGPHLFAGDLSKDDPDTLVHETVHVWQYKQGTLTRAKALKAHVGAAVLKYTPPIRLVPGRPPRFIYVPPPRNWDPVANLYKYTIGNSWNSFGFEGQAQLVEEWFSHSGQNMSLSADHYVYVKKVLYSGDPIARELTLAELKGAPPDKPEELDINVPDRQVAFEEDHFYAFSRYIEKKFRANDVAGLAARVKKLEDYCRKLRATRPADALRLAGRLQQPGDPVGRSFHYYLSRPTRELLLKILTGRS